MKSTLSGIAVGILAAGLAAFGQSTDQATAQAQGRGRGGAPFAWGDKNKDGICDFTGKPVGQGRGQMEYRGGRGMRRGMGRGMGSGMRRCCRGANAATVQPAPAPSK